MGNSPTALLVVGIISRTRELLAGCEPVLEQEFGPIAARSEALGFDFTDYYEREMGKALVRGWVAFHNLVGQDELPDFKLATIELENRFRDENRNRRLNLDPGLLTLHNLVLATTKTHSHRIYLRDGSYAEVTLRYESGAYHPLPWTYPDYRTDRCLEFLAACRRHLLAASRPLTAPGRTD